jgi:hypothetical protein
MSFVNDPTRGLGKEFTVGQPVSAIYIGGCLEVDFASATSVALKYDAVHWAA